MSDRPSRLQAEKQRQAHEQRLFLSAAGIGFAASLLAAVALGHRRAHRTAQVSGETIHTNHVAWAMKAFGIGTLYALGLAGMGVAAVNYYVGPDDSLAERVRRRVVESTGGSLMDRLGVSRKQDEESLERIDRLVSESDETTGEKKIRFARIKRLMGGEEDGEPLSEPQSEEKLSIGGRMRRFFGFGKRSENNVQSDDQHKEETK
ncbi:hypothetical protein LPJ73_005395 [Coemansia sp. RSA 2703]|nr:hypothetical protein LPJ73_005395 [Coemansia sp. RSA 2703]KAJ2378384.1 hypothetical protein IW150_000839 [Coemansia sp. RSA 2607]KAJ2391200.1 hypothetical protein GGI05_003009 [Coemansia sp. RSA 2603]